MVTSETAVQERAMLHGSDRGARFTLIEKVANSSWRTERLGVMTARTELKEKYDMKHRCMV